jgi:hypothetical protein
MSGRQLFNLDGNPFGMLVASQVTVFPGIPCAVSSVESPFVFERGREGSFDLVDDLSTDVWQELWAQRQLSLSSGIW